MHEVIILIQAIQFSISLNTSLKVSLNIQIFRVFEHVKVLEVLLNIHSVIWYFSYIYRIFYYNFNFRNLCSQRRCRPERFYVQSFCPSSCVCVICHVVLTKVKVKFKAKYLVKNFELSIEMIIYLTLIFVGAYVSMLIIITPPPTKKCFMFLFYFLKFT